MHESDTPSASRRDYLRATAGLAAAGLAGLAGCSSARAATGTLATRVSDQPGDISDFESCVVTIAGFWVKPGTGDEDDDEDDETDTTATATASDETPEESDAREYYELESPQEADLVELQGDRSTLVGEQELETGTYAFLQLDVTGVDATLADGGEATVTTPGNAPLQFKQSFEIRAETRTQFTADFTPVKRGQTGSYLLKPVASETTVSYESVEETATTTE